MVTYEPINASDSIALLNVITKNRNHFQRWDNGTSKVTTIEHAESYIRNKLATIGIWDKQALLGLVSAGYISSTNDRSVLLGYWVDQDHSGKGLVTITARRLIDHLGSNFEIDHIEIHCASDNIKSQGVPIRLGFIEQPITPESEQLLTDYPFMKVYSLRLHH